MFEEIIEFDEKKIKERNLDINKILPAGKI